MQAATVTAITVMAKVFSLGGLAKLGTTPVGGDKAGSFKMNSSGGSWVVPLDPITYRIEQRGILEKEEG